MNCHQQRSKLLKAAVYLGGQGKKHIEAQFAGKDSKAAVAVAAAAAAAAAEHTFLPTSYPSELSSGIINRDQHPATNSNSKQEADVPVEILAAPDAEGVRADLDDQATECSSSFGHTDSSEAACDGLEVESAPRPCNATEEAEDAPEASDRKKRPLNMDWKNYRRGIEWRCRWLDLRMVELNQRGVKYDQALSRLQQPQRLQASMQPSVGVSRACSLPEEHSAQPVLHRHKRKRVEDTVDNMTKHPLFSRYEKKKREFDPDGKQPDYLFEGSNLAECARSRQEEMDLDALAEPDSLERVMWKVELLQSRVARLRTLLKGSMSHPKPPLQNRGARLQTPRGAPRSTKPLCASSAAGTSKGSHTAPRRRASDYDINNVVMPVSVGTKYVEHIKHANIETPQWRNASKVSNVELRGNYCEENTDDETYKARHAPLELRERRNRYIPRSIKKTVDGDASCSRSKNYGAQ